MRLSVKRKIVLSMLGAIAAIVIVLFFITIPAVTQIRDISSQIFQERVDLEERYLRGQSIKKSQAEFRKNIDKFNTLANVFIQNEEELTLLNNLEKIASNNNIILEKELTDPNEAPQLSNNFSALSLSLNINGDFVDIVGFLNELESLDIYINLNNLTLSKTEATRSRRSAIGDFDTFDTSSKLLGVSFWQKKKIFTDKTVEEIVQ